MAMKIRNDQFYTPAPDDGWYAGGYYDRPAGQLSIHKRSFPRAAEAMIAMGGIEGTVAPGWVRLTIGFDAAVTLMIVTEG